MGRLTEIAQQLGKLYRDRAVDEMLLAKREVDERERKVLLIPDGGWPGKNEAERKAAESVALAGDEILKNIAELQKNTRNVLARGRGEIEALEAERRALEWEIRQALATAMQGKLDETTHRLEEASGIDVMLDTADEIPF